MGCNNSSESSTAHRVDRTNSMSQDLGNSTSSRPRLFNPLVVPPRGGGANSPLLLQDPLGMQSITEFANFQNPGGYHELLCHPQLAQEVMAYLPPGRGYWNLLENKRRTGSSTADTPEAIHQRTLRGEDVKNRPTNAYDPTRTLPFDGGWLTLRLLSSKTRAAVDFAIVDRVTEALVTRFVTVDGFGNKPHRYPITYSELNLASLLPFAMGDDDEEDRRAQEVLRVKALQAVQSTVDGYRARTAGGGWTEEELENSNRGQMLGLSPCGSLRSGSPTGCTDGTERMQDREQMLLRHLGSTASAVVWSNQVQDRMNILVFASGGPPPGGLGDAGEGRAASGVVGAADHSYADTVDEFMIPPMGLPPPPCNGGASNLSVHTSPAQSPTRLSPNGFTHSSADDGNMQVHSMHASNEHIEDSFREHEEMMARQREESSIPADVEMVEENYVSSEYGVAIPMEQCIGERSPHMNAMGTPSNNDIQVPHAVTSQSSAQSGGLKILAKGKQGDARRATFSQPGWVSPLAGGISTSGPQGLSSTPPSGTADTSMSSAYGETSQDTAPFTAGPEGSTSGSPMRTPRGYQVLVGRGRQMSDTSNFLSGTARTELPQEQEYNSPTIPHRPSTMLDRVAAAHVLAKLGDDDILSGPVKYRVLIVDDVVLPAPLCLGGNLVTSLHVGAMAMKRHRDALRDIKATRRASLHSRRISILNHGGGTNLGESNQDLDEHMHHDSLSTSDQALAIPVTATLNPSSFHKILILPKPYVVLEDGAREIIRARPKAIVESTHTPPNQTKNNKKFTYGGSTAQTGKSRGAKKLTALARTISKGTLFSSSVRKRIQAKKKPLSPGEEQKRAAEEAIKLQKEKVMMTRVKRDIGLVADRCQQMENIKKAPALEIRCSIPLLRIANGTFREVPLSSIQFFSQGFSTIRHIGNDFARDCTDLETIDLSVMGPRLETIGDNFGCNDKNLTRITVGRQEVDEAQASAAQGRKNADDLHVMNFNASLTKMPVSNRGFVALRSIGRNFLFRCSGFTGTTEEDAKGLLEASRSDGPLGRDGNKPSKNDDFDVGSEDGSAGSGGDAFGEDEEFDEVPAQEQDMRPLPSLSSSKELMQEQVPAGGCCIVATGFANGSLYFPMLKYIDHNFLNGCAQLIRFELAGLHSLESLGDDCLIGCRLLTRVCLGPCLRLISIGNNFCRRSKSITSIILRELPSLQVVGGCFAEGCGQLRSMDFGCGAGGISPNCLHLRAIGPNFMRDCVMLKSLSLRGLSNLGVRQVGSGFLGDCPMLRHIDADTSNVQQLLKETSEE